MKPILLDENGTVLKVEILEGIKTYFIYNEGGTITLSRDEIKALYNALQDLLLDDGIE